MKVLLDSDALNAFTGNDEKSLQKVNASLKKKGATLCLTHIQIDERYEQIDKYNDKITKLTDDLTSKGLDIEVIPTNIGVVNVSRVGMSRIASQLNIDFYRELKDLIDKCEKGKKEQGNLIRDAMIGVSAIGCDVLITCDTCLKRSMDLILEKYSNRISEIPNVVRRNPKPMNILDEILRIIQ